MATIQLPSTPALSPAATVASAIHTRVEMRDQWTDAWAPVDYIEAVTITDEVGPGMPRCGFRFEYGDVRREDTAAFAQVEPLDLVNRFVRVTRLPDENSAPVDPDIEAEPPPLPDVLFVGVFTDESIAADNVRTAEPQGEQAITAYGLVHLLDRIPIVDAVATTEGAAEPKFITYVPTINVETDFGVRGRSGVGNRSATKFETIVTNGVGESYVFSDNGDADQGDLWRVSDFLEYLLVNHATLSTLTGSFSFVLGGQVEALDAITVPATNFDGDTVKRAIDQLVDRRRGLVYWIRYSVVRAEPPDEPEDIETVELMIASAFDQDIITNGQTIAANADQLTLELDDRPDLAVVRILDTTSTADAIIVRGERMQSCFTVSFQDGTLEKAWSDADEADYLAADDVGRASDRFAHVFTTFRIPRDWGWVVFSGYGVDNWIGWSVAPRLTNTGEIDEDTVFGPSLAHRDWGSTFKRNLPIPRLVGAADDTQEFMAPLALFVKPTDDTPGPRSIHLGSTDDLQAILPERMEPTPAHVRMLDAELAFEIQARPNHQLALHHFDGAGDTSSPPVFDYEWLYATVCVELDFHLEVLQFLNAGVDGQPSGRVVTIRVPDAHHWNLFAGTIDEVRADGGVNIRFEEILRDDSDRLRAVAAFARTWYGKTRHAVEVTFQDVMIAYGLGGILTAVSVGDRQQDVGSIIVSRTTDLAEQITTIRTDFLDLDFARF